MAVLSLKTGKRWRIPWESILLSLPALAIVLALFVYPLIFGFGLSLQNADGSGSTLLNLFGMVGSVVVDSFGHQWFASWLPGSYSTEWYTYLSGDQDIGQLIFNTLIVALATTLLALLLKGRYLIYLLMEAQL